MPSTTQAISNLNLPKAPIMSQNKATVVLTDESMAKFQAQMADLASLIDSYHTNPNETTKTACDEMLRTALAGLPAESRENAMQHTPPRVYSYYQESFKGINTAGNDKKEALIQAQIHQDQQVTLTAQQIAQIKLQAAKDYSDFWSKHNEFDWKKASAEEMRKWREKDAELEKQWRAEEAKKLQNLPLEEAKLRATTLNNQRIEDNNRVINECQAIVNDPTASPDKKKAAKQLLEDKTTENGNIRNQNEKIFKEKSSEGVKEIFGTPTIPAIQKTDDHAEINAAIKKYKESHSDTEETVSPTDTKTTQLNGIDTDKLLEAFKENLAQSRTKIEQTTSSYEKTQLMSNLHETQEKMIKIEKMNNAEQDMQSLKQKLHEMKQNGTGTSHEKMQVMAKFHEAQKSYDEKLKYENAEQNVQRLTQQLHEMEQNGTGTSHEKMQLMADLHEAQKYSRELNGEKTNQGKTQPTSNKQLASTKETENPTAPKVPNENKIASDNTASQPADTHSNTEESDKSTESVSGLTTLNQAGTKLNETTDESNYLLNRSNGTELA